MKINFIILKVYLKLNSINTICMIQQVFKNFPCTKILILYERQWLIDISRNIFYIKQSLKNILFEHMLIMRHTNLIMHLRILPNMGHVPEASKRLAQNRVVGFLGHRALATGVKRRQVPLDRRQHPIFGCFLIGNSVLLFFQVEKLTKTKKTFCK